MCRLASPLIPGPAASDPPDIELCFTKFYNSFSYIFVKKKKYFGSLRVVRGCRLETMRDQDPCKSDFDLFFGESFYADKINFYAD